MEDEREQKPTEVKPIKVTDRRSSSPDFVAPEPKPLPEAQGAEVVPVTIKSRDKAKEDLIEIEVSNGRIKRVALQKSYEMQAKYKLSDVDRKRAYRSIRNELMAKKQSLLKTAH